MDTNERIFEEQIDLFSSFFGCYVSLSSALLEGQPEPETLSRAVLALEQSLLSLDSVEEVRFLVDGELADTYGPIDLP